jgi:16S rRNA (uracil1498-N3)-methyltransferase
MKDQLFYCPDIKGGFAYFPEEEARHCIQVLRHKEGDMLHFFDGKGTFYEGKLTEAGKKKCVVEIIQREERAKTPPSFLQIAIGPTKSMDRLEWFVEKCVELGIDAITPLLTRHTERKKVRTDRLFKVALAACKQSLKAQLPQIDELRPFASFLEATQAIPQRFIAYVSEEPLPHLKAVYQIHTPAVILIGPEGDFSPEEIMLAKESGFQPVSLGPSRLRTETAGVVACHTIHLAYQEV